MELPARIGRYEITLELGRGELGRVFLARDTVLRRQVALKALREDLELTPEERAQLTERVRQEACAAASLSHPVIATLHDMGEDPELGLFLVFELVPGPTLREKLESGPLPAAEVAQLARALGSTLTYAHGKGLLHRGVKPENVMLAPTGPLLTDFGWFPADRAPVGPSVACGYSAPEVLASGAFSAYGDQFSLAATLFEALTGVRAFQGPDAAAIAARVATAKQAPPSSLVPALRAFPHVDPILDRALAKEAKNRFLSCEAFTSVLAIELDGSGARFLETPVPRSSIVPRATRRWQNSAALTAVAVIVLLAIVGRVHPPSGGQGAQTGQGVSLKRVASAFAGTVAAAGRSANPSAAPQHPSRTPAFSALQPLPPPPGTLPTVTPSGARVTPGVTSAPPAISAPVPGPDPLVGHAAPD